MHTGSDEIVIGQTPYDSEGTPLESSITRYPRLSSESELYPQKRSLPENALSDWFDSDHFALTMYHEKRVHHPVDTVWSLMVVADGYDTTQNPQDWEILEKNLQKLIDKSELDDQGRRWFVYRFTHERGKVIMQAPWVSGMAQGMLLSLIARMYDHHPSDKLKEYATQTFQSFLKPRTPDEYWVTDVVPCPSDSSIECTFLEEYPQNTIGTQVVNGHIYGMVGLHDYFRMTADEKAKDLFERSAHAIAQSFPLYRNENNISFYAISDLGKETWGTPANYHMGVIRELQALTKITGDKIFSAQADILLHDHSE